MHIFTTTRDNWLIAGMTQALLMEYATVTVSSEGTAGALVCSAANLVPPDSVLLLVFPENQPLTCQHSLTFLGEWLRLRESLFFVNLPCILWGNSPPIRFMPDAARLPIIPWHLSPEQFCRQVTDGMRVHQPRCRKATPPRGVRLTPRGEIILRYTLEGWSLDQIAQELGVTVKTVWTLRRRAMNSLGVFRVRDLVRYPVEMLCETSV